MKKKILSLLSAVLICVSATYMDTEQKYFFTSDALIKALQSMVHDEQKRADAATVYSQLMNQQTGMVSIDNLFAVCRAAGFNTYRKDGFDSCKQFINSISESEEEIVTGFCPGLDENGKNPNALKSITDKTQIGDFCSSTNIYSGEVVFKKGYNCTCMASACNDGYEFKGGACVTIVADGQGFCLRSDNKIQKDMKLEEAKAFCENLSKKNRCKYKSVVILHKELRILCNATQTEVDNVKQLMAEHKEKQKEKQIAAIKYYEVCGKDKNKTGKKEYCIDSFFNWTQTHFENAVAFATDYARLKYGNTILCSNKHRTLWNDDYIACATKNGDAFYEFKFDDIRESVDATRRASERYALCRLVGGNLNVANQICNVKNCDNLSAVARKYGHTVKNCAFTSDGNRNTMGKDEFEKSLAKIDGLDNRAFFNLQVVAVRGNFVLEKDIIKYVKGNISTAKKIYCDPGYKTIKVADGILEKIIGDHDDIKRCYVDGKPIDFVFNDLSEIMDYERDAGEDGAKCIANNGKFDGHYCRGLTKQECFELEKKLLAELKKKSWSGDTDLVDWDEDAGACELNSAQFANNVNKTGKYTAVAGLTIGGAVTGGATTSLAIGLMATELAGMVGEMYVERKKELLPQQWANEFLTSSRSCKSSACAESALRNNFAKISQASDMLNRDVLKQVDDELARLGELLPEARLQQIMDNPNAPDCWETWECQERIFVFMQMASLASGVGKALVKFTKVIAKKAGAAATKGTSSLVKTADNVDNVKGAIWDAAAKRYRDPKTGKFVSGYTSWTNELAEIGVKEEKTATGAVRYKDIKTGKYISEDEVLKRIDNMPGKTATPKPADTSPAPKPDEITPKKSEADTPNTKPADTKPVSSPGTPKRTPAQEEAEWRALYEKYAPENQTFENFKESFGNNLDEVEEYSKGWEVTREQVKTANNKAEDLWTDFHKKYDANDNSFSYGTYSNLRKQAEANPKIYTDPQTGLKAKKIEYPSSKTPGLESWSKEQIEDAAKVYEAQREAELTGNLLSKGKGANYSTFDHDIASLRRELQNNTASTSVYGELSNRFFKLNSKNPNTLTEAEYKNIKSYVEGGEYDERMLKDTFAKDPEISGISARAKNNYKKFLETKSKNVQKIDEVAGVSKINSIGEQIAKNEFVQNFVSKRVSMYEDIITKNPSIYNQAKKWEQLSIKEREKLCKEIFEIADTELGVNRTNFAVKDLVKDFGASETVAGIQRGGDVYLSSRHFPNMSFKDVMETLAHEQAHKVDKLNPNRGILGSQLADLGGKEGYIQGYAGRSYADYRKELTEQSSWMIGDAMKKAISKLGL